MTQQRIGDRPQFPLANQRFDKGDANDISRYYEELIARYAGSIYGQAWGCLSNPGFQVLTTAVGNLPYIRPSKCVLMFSVPADNVLNATDQDRGPWSSTIVLYDPTRQGQVLPTLYTSAAYAAGQRPWILFRRNETDTHEGNKAYWDTTTNNEQIDAAPLQRSEWVEFKLSVSYSVNDRNERWYRCAYIDSWDTASGPVIVPIHWMDSQHYLDSTPPAPNTRVASALALPGNPAAVGLFGFDPATEMPAVAKLMHWMAGKLGQHYSSAGTTQVTTATSSLYQLKPGAFVSSYTVPTGGWLGTPTRGLLELHNGLAFLEDTQVPAINNNIDVLGEFMQDYKRTLRLLHTLYVTPIMGSTWATSTFAVTPAANTTSTNSLSPDLRANSGGGTGGTVLANDLVYQLVPLNVSGNKVQLTLTAGSAFEIGSVSVLPNHTVSASLISASSLVVTQNYMTAIFPPVGTPPVTPPPITTPPGRYIRVQFVVRSASGGDLGDDLIRPFTIHIFGRNV